LNKSGLALCFDGVGHFNSALMVRNHCPYPSLVKFFAMNRLNKKTINFDFESTLYFLNLLL
jgi:hypothetical protein